MRRTLLVASTIALAITLHCPRSAEAQSHQHPVLHVDPQWKECSFRLDPALTQSAWRQFTREAGLVAYFRPLRDARPMGRGNVELSVLQWETAIHDEDAAWNDTFVHPDSTHWLVEGSGLRFPGLTARMGVTRRVDVAAFFTRNPNANYGFWGGQVQYNVVDDTVARWAASTRASVVSLFGPDDLAFTVTGVEALASRTYRVSSRTSLAPYVGVSAYHARAHERSAVVSLADERVTGAQAMSGVVVRLWKASLSAEYNVGRVRSRSLRMGIEF